ncbi:MAG: type III pantothenate kinase [candidate division Zixibacteria bacterium]|nr:type III pantothenate kinase [candidate division Zixibacteria bacterium]
MLLAIDIGNTNTVAGLFVDGELQSKTRLESVRINPFLNIWAPMWGWFQHVTPSLEERFDIAVASVVPQLTNDVEDFFETNLALRPFIIDSDTKLPLKLKYDDPSQIGPDRICNAVAAKELYQKDNRPVVVVDFGTATTFDIISADGDYLGGIIAPSPKTAVANLAEKTALLFEVPIEPPATGIIAKNTEDAIKSGMFYGTIGMIEYMLNKIAEELDSKPIAIATGGLAPLVNKHCKLFETVDEDLTLKGIARVFGMR